MNQISISDFRQNLPSIADRVLDGEEFEVLRNRMPIGVFRASTSKKRTKKATKRILPGVFGMWKDRWPEDKPSVEIVNEWRRQEENRSYGR